MTSEKIAEAINLLKNAGYHNIRVDDKFIYIEDPSCILRSFETFLDYAWIGIAFITVALLTGWAVSMLRGVKQTNLIKNVRNLAFMFLLLSLIRPTMDLLYGGNLFAKGCKIINIELEELQKLLDARDAKLEKQAEVTGYEKIEMFVSEQIIPKKKQTQPIQVQPVQKSTVNVSYTPPANKQKKETPHISGLPIVAYPDNEDVVYLMADGSGFRLIAGTRAWRNTNPVAIKDSNLAHYLGAIGVAEKLAVFPSEEIGMDALKQLMQAEQVAALTIRDMLIQHIGWPEENQDAYHTKLQELTQIPLDKQMSTLGAVEIDALARAIAAITEWETGIKQEKQ